MIGIEPEDTVDHEKEESTITPEISFNTMEGQFHPSTMWVTGSYNGRQLSVLIHNGRTHNFIKKKVVARLSLPTTATKPFKVQVGSGDYLLCSEKCSLVTLKLQDHEVLVDLFLLDINGTNVVLGVQWLAELGEVMINHKELTLTFQSSEGVTKLHGEKLLAIEPINSKVVKKMVEANNISCLFSMQVISEVPPTPQPDLPAPIQQLLQDFAVVFAEPKHLPPKRSIDHGAANITKPYTLCKTVEMFLFTTSVEYLGHIISKHGVHVDPKKIVAMVDWPILINVKQLRGFLELTSYYRKFIAGYASIAHPLTDLLKKNQFKWQEETEMAFQQLMQCMTKEPVLTLPNFTLPYMVDIDASNKGIGAVLSQNGHPVAFFSKKLCSKLANASTYVRELYAITQAIMKWRHYFLGHKFTIRTDHKSLRELMRQVIQTPEQKFYLSKLLGFHYEIVYRLGKSNATTDALSMIEEMHVDEEEGGVYLSMAAFRSVLGDDIRECNATNSSMLHYHQQFQQQLLPSTYTVVNDVLFFEDKAFIPDDDIALKHKIMRVFHASPIGGHGGITKTFKAITELFYWRYLCKDVEAFVSECLVCQKRYNYLPWAELWYNSTFHLVIGMPPYKALYGVNPNTLPGYDLGSCSVEMKKQADKKRKDKNFAEGDYVLVKFHHYKQSLATQRLNYKLSKRYFGPYRIERKVGKEEPLPEDVLPEDLLPAAIVSFKWESHCKDRVKLALVEWLGRPREESTWEEWEVLTSTYRNLNLEDKVVVEEGNDDTIGTLDRDTEAQVIQGLAERPKRTIKKLAWMGDYVGG
ncbi:Transposon Ty3-G Gag-Pol polyprotein [Senna tora]|uniref:Transposon Ty3-G Gag-Pol polyprotein n=1 Tax=Senna tora TaxID=362788 RepID=A0A834WPZ7_9FABA|nr:Transposon Ty3-G Gag-Pol polyprotein [Senna tora]